MGHSAKNREFAIKFTEQINVTQRRTNLIDDSGFNILSFITGVTLRIT